MRKMECGVRSAEEMSHLTRLSRRTANPSEGFAFTIQRCNDSTNGFHIHDIRGQELRCHCRRRRKNCGLFVAGSVTDLLLPSLVMLAALAAQLAGEASAPTCSSLKSAVSAEGQETITSGPERRIERAGRVSK